MVLSAEQLALRLGGLGGSDVAAVCGVNPYKTALDVYREKVGEFVVTAAKEEYRDFLQEHREVLIASLPDDADQEALEKFLNEFESLGERIIERYYVDEVTQQTKRTLALWEKIEPVNIPDSDEPPLQTQLAEYFLDWSAMSLTDTARKLVQD